MTTPHTVATRLLLLSALICGAAGAATQAEPSAAADPARRPGPDKAAPAATTGATGAKGAKGAREEPIEYFGVAPGDEKAPAKPPAAHPPGARVARAAPRPPSAAAVQTDPAGDDELVMYAGEARVIEVGATNRIAIGNGKIASTTVIEKTKLLIIAQEVGLTNILIWNKPNLSREIRLRVTALNVLKQQRDIKAALADLTGVQVVRRGDRLYVEGSISTREDLAKITALTAQNANLVNSTKLDIDTVPAYKQESQMLVFDLYFVEFKKGYLENLGVNWAKSFNGFNIGVFGEATGGNLDLRPLPQASGAGGASFNLPDTKVHGVSTAINASIAIPSIIQLAVDSGDAFVLASPSIATRNGGQARFVAGGEVPIPTVSQNGTNVTFKPYGILLEIAPKLDEFSNITGVLKAEVSKIDPSVSVGGIPGFTTRRTETDFSVKTGDAIILSGLYSQDGSNSVEKVPGLGDVPLLGNLFKSTGTTRNQTEVYLVAIPHTQEGEAASGSNALRNLNNRINQSRRAAGMPERADLPSLRDLGKEVVPVAPAPVPAPEPRPHPVHGEN